MLKAFAPLLYVKLCPERLSVRDVKTGVEISEVPELAISRISGQPKVLGVGMEATRHAAQAGAELMNPFTHPRTLISDFTGAEVVVKALVQRVLKGRRWSLAPRILMHPLGNPTGGFTQVERRAVRELALGAGASVVWVWVGRELLDAEIQSHEFQAQSDLMA